MSNLLDLAGLSDAAPAGLFGDAASGENGHAYSEIAQSRTILEGVLKKPDAAHPNLTYFDRYAPKRGSVLQRQEMAVAMLKEDLSVRFDTRSSLFHIKVSASDAVAAADIANQLVAELRRFNVESRQTKARDAVNFIAGRVSEAQTALTTAESQLAVFRERNARIGNAPELELQQKRLERSVRFNEDAYALLSRQFELARIQEKKDAPVFSVVEPAIPPAKPAKFSAILAAVVAAFLSAASLILIQTGQVILSREVGVETGVR